MKKVHHQIVTLTFSVSGSSSVPADSDINSNIRSLNIDQRNVFDAVYRWARNYVKSRSSKISALIYNWWRRLLKVTFTQKNLPSSH